LLNDDDKSKMIKILKSTATEDLPFNEVNYAVNELQLKVKVIESKEEMMDLCQSSRLQRRQSVVNHL
jgi:hypothetical protein